MAAGRGLFRTKTRNTGKHPRMAVFEETVVELSIKPLQTTKTAAKAAKHPKGSTKVVQTLKTAKAAKLRVLGTVAVFVYRLSMLMITRRGETYARVRRMRRTHERPCWPERRKVLS